MDAVSFSDARRRLAEIADDAESEPVFITRAGGKTLVLMDAGEWSSIQETAHLLTTDANRVALARSLAQASAKQTVPIDLDDL